MMSNGDDLDRRFPESELMAQDFCKAGVRGTCANLMHYYAAPDTLNPEAAFEMVKGGCDMGETNFCYWLGDRYIRGDGTDVNPAKAKVIFKRLCTEQYRDSCRRVVALGKTFDTMSKTNVSGAVCQQGDTKYCRVMAWNYVNGDGVAVDIDAAIKLFEQSCDEGLGISCVDLGSLYDFAMYGVAEDKAKAKALYQKGCDLGEYMGCRQLGG